MYRIMYGITKIALFVPETLAEQIPKQTVKIFGDTPLVRTNILRASFALGTLTILCAFGFAIQK